MIETYDEALAVMRAKQKDPDFKLSPWGFETTDFSAATSTFSTLMTTLFRPFS